MKPEVVLWSVMIALYLAVTGRLSNALTVLQTGGGMSLNSPHQTSYTPPASSVIPAPVLPKQAPPANNNPAPSQPT